MIARVYHQYDRQVDTMTNPIIARNQPTAIELKKGEDYYFCRCGRSQDQPFCDGSHAGTEFKPKHFTAEEDGTAILCNCKHSNNIPFCDGTHNQFSDEMVGKEGPGDTAKSS
ncbi:MAG: CDGSH-type Zn-finger protein [Paraglaciecola sp.]|jgi:CDGSH-type Zn-finger protein